MYSILAGDRLCCGNSRGLLGRRLGRHFSRSFGSGIGRHLCRVSRRNKHDRLGRGSRDGIRDADALVAIGAEVDHLLIADANGEQTPIKKVKGRGNSLNEIVRLLKESIINSENQRIYIAHADCAEEAEEVKKMIEEQIPCKEIYVGYIGPIIGASIGPDALSVFAFGEEVTYKA